MNGLGLISLPIFGVLWFCHSLFNPSPRNVGLELVSALDCEVGIKPQLPAAACELRKREAATLLLTRELSVALTCCWSNVSGRGNKLEGWEQGWWTSPFSFLCFFSPGVRWGRKDSGLCCQARVPSFNLEECWSPEKSYGEGLQLCT